MLKELKLPGLSGLHRKGGGSGSNLINRRIDNKIDSKIDNLDADIACNIVDIVFKYIDISLRENKSIYKVDMIAKALIESLILKDATRDGVKSFIRGMYPGMSKAMIDEMQREMEKRRGR